MYLFSGLFFILLIFFLPLSAATISFLLMRRWAGKRTVCAKCHYPSEGLTVLRCPECGSDLREVGLLPIGISLRWITAFTVGGWVFVSFVLIMFYGWRLTQTLSMMTNANVTAGLSGGRSGAYNQVNMQGVIRSRSGWFGAPGTVSILQWSADFLWNNVSLATLTVDENTESAVFRVADKEFQHKGQFEATQLAVWLETLSDRAYRAAFKPEAETILFISNSWKQDALAGVNPTSLPALPPGPRLFTGVGGGYAGGSQTAVPACVWIMYLSYLAVVLFGGLIIQRWGWRRLRQVIAQYSARSSPVDG